MRKHQPAIALFARSPANPCIVCLTATCVLWACSILPLGSMKAEEHEGRNPAMLKGAAAEANQALRSELPVKGKAKVQFTNAVTLGSTQADNNIDPSLVETGAWIASSNLLASKHKDKAAERREQLQIRLDSARQLRREKSQAAASHLAEILNLPDVPDDIRRTAMLELALAAQQDSQLARAQQILAQYVSTFPEDPSVPEILLRQGLMLREMGAYTQALNKFFAVLSSSLSVKYERVEYYQRLVLQAQTEIADTYFTQEKYDEAIYNFRRLLKLESDELNRPSIQSKLVHSLVAMSKNEEAIVAAREYLQSFGDDPEMRYLLAGSLKKLGRNREALEEVLHLLETQQSASGQKPEVWVYWQQRTGNDIANLLYKEGDYQSALMIYHQLAGLSQAPEWQLPVLYQIGLVYERLQQPDKAIETYRDIVSKELPASTNAPSSQNLTVLMDMARWRGNYLGWQTNVDAASRALVIHGPTNSVVLR